MSYKIIISTTEQKIGEDTLQLFITFTVNGTGTDLNWNAKDKGIRVSDWGNYGVSYNLDDVNSDGDAFLAAGACTFKLQDFNDELETLFFGTSTLARSIDKRPTVEIKLNGNYDYKGRLKEQDGVTHTSGLKELTLNFDPNTQAINQKKIYLTDGSPADPLGYGVGSTGYAKISEIIEKIYQLADPTIPDGSLNIVHDWKFYGIMDGAYPYPINDITLDELYIQLYPLFSDTSKGLNNCGDILRKIAIDWCAFTGFLPSGEIFFKKLFSYDANNLQTIGKIRHQEKGYRYGLIDYVLVKVIDPSSVVSYANGTDTGLDGRSIVRDSLPGFWMGQPYPASPNISNVRAEGITRSNWFGCYGDGNRPNAGDVYSCNSSQFAYRSIYTFTDGFGDHDVLSFVRISGTNDLPSSGTLTRASGSGETPITFVNGAKIAGVGSEFTIFQVADPVLLSGEYHDFGSLVSEFWYKNRAFIDKCRTDIFLLDGLDYSYLKDFNTGGSKFQPLSIQKQNSKGYTQIEAIYSGELSDIGTVYPGGVQW